MCDARSGGRASRQVSSTAAARLGLICAAGQSVPVAQSSQQVLALPSPLSWQAGTSPWLGGLQVPNRSPIVCK